MFIQVTKRNILFLILSIIVINGALLFVYQSSKYKENYDSKIENTHSVIHKDFKNQILTTQRDYSIKIDALLNRAGVTKAFADKDREKLYELVQKHFNYLIELDPYLKIMTFRLDNGSTFLRVHKPEMYGDPLNKKRKIIIDVNEKKERLFGFEIGKLKMSYRVVTPIFYKNSYIGLVEVGIMTERFTKDISKLFNVSHALIVKSENTNVSLKNQSYMSKDGFSITSDDPMLQKIFQIAFSTKKETDKFHYESETGEYFSVDNSLKLFDQNGETVAKILLASNISDFKHEYQSFMRDNIISILILSLIVIYLLNLTFNYFINKLERSNKALKEKMELELKLTYDLNQSLQLFGENVVSSKADINGHITYVSPALEDLSGYDQKELVGRHQTVLMHQDMNQSTITNIRETVNAGETWEGEIKGKKKDGSHFWLKCSLLPDFDKNNNVQGYTSISHDITAQKAKDQFLSNMSHELRTPLNAIIGFSSILTKKLTQKAYKEMAKQIHSSSENLLNLINDILDLSKIKDENFTLNPYQFNAYHEINAFTEQFEVLVHQKGLNFHTHLSESLKAMFLGDLTRINQISLNLISNAIKFTPKNGDVSFSADYHEGNFILKIKDNGIGMNKLVQDKIFKPFVQADGSTTRHYGGTGLGLSITQNLVELMQGKIELESEEEKGSTFIVTLPIEKVGEAQKDEEVHLEASKEGTISGNVLIAEDNKTNQMLIKLLLEDYGLETTLANDGIEVVRLYNPDIHNLILMDENMPNRNGTEAMEILRDKYQEKCAPIIALTANAMEGDKTRFIKAGMDDYLSKPINEDLLYEILKKYLT